MNETYFRMIVYVICVFKFNLYNNIILLNVCILQAFYLNLLSGSYGSDRKGRQLSNFGWEFVMKTVLNGF